ncbi:hypothetical protein CJ030_MR7G027596 [Morella rubra]|uniref:RNase H type-1 domain-containing protein n=1 Tax=Morella rubra TaxID=262757 RepID=A0A6A1V2A1_9ROSI|nr:hypothetical protein CJ030_MR7G027596 [Morella rubra]
MRWNPPPPSVWKLNCDAACRGSHSSLAVVCRDSSGSLLAAWTDHLVSSNPLLAELSAVLLACHVAHSSTDGAVHIEGDSLIG